MTGRGGQPAEPRQDDAGRAPDPSKEDRRPPRQPAVKEIGGPKGPEPTRYGDWEKGGRCSDF